MVQELKKRKRKQKRKEFTFNLKSVLVLTACFIFYFKSSINPHILLEIYRVLSNHYFILSVVFEWQ